MEPQVFNGKQDKRQGGGNKLAGSSAIHYGPDIDDPDAKEGREYFAPLALGVFSVESFADFAD